MVCTVEGSREREEGGRRGEVRGAGRDQQKFTTTKVTLAGNPLLLIVTCTLLLEKALDLHEGWIKEERRGGSTARPISLSLFLSLGPHARHSVAATRTQARRQTDMQAQHARTHACTQTHR